MTVVTTAPDAVVEPAEPDDTELLARHRPALRYDAQGAFRPLAVEAVVGSELRRVPRILNAIGGDARRLRTIDELGAGSRLARFDRLVEPAPPTESARRLQADPRYANTVYGDVARTEKHVHVRYWLFFYFATGTLLGSRRHQGDWQLVEVTLDARSLHPTAVTCSHGAGGGQRADAMTDVEWVRCRPPCAGSCRHPVLYVEPLTHHCYFEQRAWMGSPVAFEAPAPDVLPRVVRLGAWKDWPGIWGSGWRSPRSPDCVRALGAGRFMRKASERRPARRRRLWRLSNRFAPPAPAIAVTVENDSLDVSWRVERGVLRRGRWLLLTVHAGPAPAPPACARVVRVRGREGRARVVLQAPATADLVVRASAYSAVRWRGPVTTSTGPHARAEPSPGPSARDDWSPRVWREFHRRLMNMLLAHGAMTVDELERRGLHVLDLTLDRDELLAVVDSARRHGLVRPLEHTVKADGSEDAAVEWAPTEEGRKRA